MRFLKGFLIAFVVVISIGSFTLYFAKNNESVQLALQSVWSDNVRLDDSYNEYFQLYGKEEMDLLNKLGQPDRKDPTPYDYDWWIYKDDDAYMQFGIEDGKIVTMALIGDLDLKPFKTGESYDVLKEKYDFQNEVTYSNILNEYTFLLKDEHIKTNPLIQLEKNLFVVLYFDQFTEELSSVRLIPLDVLTKQQMYDVEYRGHLNKMEPDRLSEFAWQPIEAAVEEQIFEMTNLYRKRHGLHEYTYNEELAHVAYKHSRDMAKNTYFSHDNLRGESVGDRIRKDEVAFKQAAENIAYNYADALAVTEGWLNSEGHREALLNESLREIGVGVYKLYYTQNFILK